MILNLVIRNGDSRQMRDHHAPGRGGLVSPSACRWTPACVSSSACARLAKGKTVQAAIEAGYDRAFNAILDSNVTTLITAFVLWQFGTGPVKGFATTLSISIIVSMFTAWCVRASCTTWSRRAVTSTS
jgi:hypothetical protein